MSDNEWGDLEAQTVIRLQTQKVYPVPAPIVKQAQRALDGVPHPDDPDLLIHALQYQAPTVEKAVEFERHMRNAGVHTHPKSSIVVVRDPERKWLAKFDENGEPVIDPETGKPVRERGPVVNPRLVTFRAGQRRGRGGVAS